LISQKVVRVKGPIAKICVEGSPDWPTRAHSYVQAGPQWIEPGKPVVEQAAQHRIGRIVRDRIDARAIHDAGFRSRTFAPSECHQRHAATAFDRPSLASPDGELA
jgi:hypothetical protein